MNEHSAPRQTDFRSSRFRGGFTLVELMIAVALTVLIMSMFVQVFQLASASITRQKGIANLDQSERTLTTILRADISRRTFRDVVPFNPGQSPPGPLYTSQKIGKRRGYFSISENDPDDNTDDVLQFTIETINPNNPNDATDREKSVLFGRAAFLRPSANSDTDYDTLTELNAYLAANPNQPEFDDGRFSVNRIGSSKAAEVSYFLRNGILYRRVLLIRESYDDSPTPGAQPPETEGRDYSLSSTYSLSLSTDPTPTPIPTGNFWNDFDYSAFYRTGAPAGLWFHGLSSLNNDVGNPATFPASLGVPYLRFGHSLNRTDGTPREFVNDASGNPRFIGRFTVQETANSAFGYPGRIPTVGTPPVPNDPFVDTTLTYNDQTGLVTQFSGQTDRRGQDILLTNVHEFDVKVWDNHPQVQAFVDLGHDRTDTGAPGGNPIGYYNAANNRNPSYGVDGAGNPHYHYDTWHPWAPPLGGSPAYGLPPFRPVSNGPDGQPGVAGVDDDNQAPTDDALEQGWLGTDDEIPLKAIQITIRFFDTTSNRMRQLTLVLSLVD